MKKGFLVLALCLSVPLASAQNIRFPNAFGFGISIGMRGGDQAPISVDLTTPYLQVGGGYLALRASGEIMSKDGIPVGGTSTSWAVPAYYQVRLGWVVAAVPNDSMRLYGECGGLGVFPTSDVATSTYPYFGIYIHYGAELFAEAAKHLAVFFEMGDEATNGAARADKFQGAPLMARGLTACAGVRYYF